MTSSTAAGMAPPANVEVELFLDWVCAAVCPFVTPDWTTCYLLLADRVERSLAPCDEVATGVTSPITAPWRFNSPRSNDEACFQMPALACFQMPMPTSPLPGSGTPPMPAPMLLLFLPSPVVGPALPAGPHLGSPAPPLPPSPSPALLPLPLPVPA